MPNQSGVVRSDSMNRTQAKHVHNYSTFDDSLSYKLANTLRFGDLTPSFVMEGEPKDSISLNSKDLIDSLSLKAPFKGSIRKIKDSFAVPKMAILPFNWDLIYTQPVNGDDVPTDANCVLQTFPARFSSFWTDNWTLVVNNIPGSSASDADVAYWLTALMRVLVLGEYVYSHGSLLNITGYKASAQFVHEDCTISGGYDEFFDRVVSKVFANFLDFKVVIPRSNSSSLTRVFAGLSQASPRYSADRIGSFRHLLEIFRENPICYFDGSASGNIEYDTDLTAFLADAATYPSDPLFVLNNLKFVLPSFNSDPSSPTFDDAMSFNNLNLSRILAYQICCFHYYTNSALDPIYSAELYRQYVNSFFRGIFRNETSPDLEDATRFSRNGIILSYDFLSGHVLERQLYLTRNGSQLITPTYAGLSGSSPSAMPYFLGSWAAIFAIRKSLRYGDYFVGSRPRPIAPINTDVAVNNNMVSVIDITKKQWAQKFGNAVMRSRQKIEEYVKSLFGDAPAPDYHNPFFLASESELIYGDEVQNTADAQQLDANSRTANFASSMNQYTFTFNNDDNHPCIYLQIISFDVKRYYSRSVERQFFVLDRYDMFNPDFQYIGDQPVYGIELGYPGINGYVGSVVGFPNVFGYQSRDMEYKQRFDQACGGFVANQLPGWILSDFDRSAVFTGSLDSDFIRSYNTELDQFYLSLTGYSLGTYFHFVCITNNLVNAKRAMAVDPQILGI